MKIGIITGSIRDDRLGEGVAAWVNDAAAKRDDEGVTFEAIDLKSFNVPLLTSATVPGAANKKYDDENVTKWSQAIDACDAFIFVTPEYNHAVPGAFKNAYDSLGNEWRRKPVAFVSYGAEGGVRAVENWRQVVANFEQFDIRAQVTHLLHEAFGEDGFSPVEQKSKDLENLFDTLIEVTRKLGS